MMNAPFMAWDYVEKQRDSNETVLSMRISQKINFHAYSSGTEGQTV
jgi:hypothetical protein